MRILYIHGSFVPPPCDPAKDRFALLSQTLEGDVLQPVWFSKPEQVESQFGPDTYPVYRRGNFEYHWHLYDSCPGPLKKLATFWFHLRTGHKLHRRKPYDCIVTYSHMTTALIGVMLKMATGARLICEIVTSPHLVNLTDRPRPTLRDRLRKLYSDLCLHVTVLSCDRLHLLFPGQLDKYPLLRKKAASVFHEFIPTSAIRSNRGEREPFILFVGAPWYLKGVDLLVKAFEQIAGDYPAISLKLLGFFPDRSELDELIRGVPRVEILKARPNPEVLEVMNRAMIFALPSRCEGLPRVVLEAMAAGLPVVASDVGGIPDLVRDGKDGFIVPSGEPAALASRLRQLLSDSELRRRLGESGYERVRQEMNEEVYIRQFTAMIQAAVAQR